MSKRKTYNFLLSIIISLTVISAFALLLSGAIPFWGTAPWLGIIIGALCMVAAIPLHLYGKKLHLCYLISILANSCGSGVFIATCFTYLHVKPTPEAFVIPFLVSAVLMLLRCVICLLPQKAFAVINCILLALNVIMSIAALVIWIIYGSAYLGSMFPLIFFFLIPEFWNGVFMMVFISDEDGGCMRCLSFGSFGYALIIGLVALFILSEGELLDGIGDLFSPSDGKKSKK